MTQNIDFYPQNWRELAFAVKEANGWRCGACDRQCRRPGEFWLGWEYELTVAHLGHDYEAEIVQVAPMCRRCHFRYDAPHSWRARHRHRRYRRRLAGQLEIFR